MYNFQHKITVFSKVSGMLFKLNKTIISKLKNEHLQILLEKSDSA